MYQEVKCRKDLSLRYREQFLMCDYKGKDATIILCSLLILEDICKYLDIKRKLLLDYIINENIEKSFGQEF